MTKTEKTLRDAHAAALVIVSELKKVRELASVMSILKPGSPEFVDLDLCRISLQAAHDAGKDVLEPDPFADLHDGPLLLEGHTVTSGHDGALELAASVLEMTWSCDAYDEFYANYYCHNSRRLDLEAARECENPPTVWIYDMSFYGHGAHRKLLKTEYARATKEARVHKWVPDISDDEKFVLLALHDGPLGWKRLAKEVKGNMAGSQVRTLLSRMEGRGLLNHTRARGYWRGILADAALEKADFDGI